MRRSTILLAMVFALLLGAMAALTLFVQAPSLRTNSGAGDFNAILAKARLAAVLGVERPHPADSSANDDVRARLVSMLRGMGISPVVRDQIACNELYKERGVSCARVRNVIAVLGPARGPALLLNAHYDSVAAGPGASDDGMGVATLLGFVDALGKKPLGRPVILLFNEGEELGLLGARAFLDDPLSKWVDSLVNLDARGVTGPVNMFETSRPNAPAIAWFKRAASRPSANSLATDIYRLLPNYTDVNSFSERGWLTVNLAPVGNETRYHGPGDNIRALDPASLQHMGDQTLALARSLPAAAHEKPAGTEIFMDLAGQTLIALPLWTGAILLMALLGLFAAMTSIRGGFIRSSGIVLGTIAGSAALASVLLVLVGAFRAGMFWRAHPAWTFAANYSAVILVGSLLIACLGGPLCARQLRSAFWLLFLCLGAIIGLEAPGGIVFFLIPPLIVGLGSMMQRLWKNAEAAASAAAILFLYFTWGEVLGVLQELLNDGPMWVFAPVSSLLLAPVLIEFKSLMEKSGPRAAVGTAGIFTAVLWAIAAAAPAYSSDRQQRFVIQHVTDSDTGKAWWSILNDGAPLPEAFRSGWSRGRLPLGRTLRWLHPAPLIGQSLAPSATLVSTIRNGNERTILVRLAANGNETIELIANDGAKIRSAGIGGSVRPIDPGLTGKYFIDCSGRSCDGAVLQLTTEGPKKLEFLIVGSRASLPASARPLVEARPRFARPQYRPDGSLSFARAIF